MSEELIAITKDVNQKLGYELYDKLDRESLIADFLAAEKELYKHAWINQKAVREYSDDILIDVVKAHENFDSMEMLEVV